MPESRVAITTRGSVHIRRVQRSQRRFDGRLACLTDEFFRSSEKTPAYALALVRCPHYDPREIKTVHRARHGTIAGIAAYLPALFCEQKRISARQTMV